MKRGDVWWADLPKPVGRRPVVILSRDSSIAVRDNLIVSEVIRTKRNIPVEVSLGRDEGLKVECVINLDVISTIPKRLLTQWIGSLSAQKISEIDQALKFALQIS